MVFLAQMCYRFCSNANRVREYVPSHFTIIINDLMEDLEGRLNNPQSISQVFLRLFSEIIE